MDGMIWAETNMGGLKMIRKSCLALLLIFVILFQATGLTAFADVAFSGSGTAEDPYLIQSAEELVLLSTLSNTTTEYSDKAYKLTADLDMSGIDFRPIGHRDQDNNIYGAEFSGSLDGDGHVISNLTIDTTKFTCSWGCFIGLIGSASNAVIKNLGIDGIQFITDRERSRLGGLVGRSEATRIENCFIKDCVLTDNNTANLATIGGLAGYWFEGSSMSNCYSLGLRVEKGGNANYIGGLIGGTCSLEATQVTNCYTDYASLEGSWTAVSGAVKPTRQNCYAGVAKNSLTASSLGNGYKDGAEGFPVLAWENTIEITTLDFEGETVGAAYTTNVFDTNTTNTATIEKGADGETDDATNTTKYLKFDCNDLSTSVPHLSLMDLSSKNREYTKVSLEFDLFLKGHTVNDQGWRPMFTLRANQKEGNCLACFLPSSRKIYEQLGGQGSATIEWPDQQWFKVRLVWDPATQTITESYFAMDGRLIGDITASYTDKLNAIVFQRQYPEQNSGYACFDNIKLTEEYSSETPIAKYSALSLTRTETLFAEQATAGKVQVEAATADGVVDLTGSSEVTYTTSDAAVVDVAGDGQMAIGKAGIAVITAKAGTAEARVIVTVYKESPVVREGFEDYAVQTNQFLETKTVRSGTKALKYTQHNWGSKYTGTSNFGKPNGIAQGWFYDYGSGNAAIWLAATDGTMGIMIGAQPQSTEYYCVQNDSSKRAAKGSYTGDKGMDTPTPLDGENGLPQMKRSTGWHQVVCVVDGDADQLYTDNGTITLYLDGVEIYTEKYVPTDFQTILAHRTGTDYTSATYDDFSMYTIEVEKPAPDIVKTTTIDFEEEETGASYTQNVFGTNGTTSTSVIEKGTDGGTEQLTNTTNFLKIDTTDFTSNPYYVLLDISKSKKEYTSVTLEFDLYVKQNARASGVTNGDWRPLFSLRERYSEGNCLACFHPQKRYIYENTGDFNSLPDSLIATWPRREWFKVRIVWDAKGQTLTESFYNSDGEALGSHRINFTKRLETLLLREEYPAHRNGMMCFDNITVTEQYAAAAPTLPVADNVRIVSGKTATGESLQGSYTYYDANDDEEAGSTYRWLRGDSENGTFEAIAGADGIEYTLTEADEDNYIKFEVTPRNAVDIEGGVPVQSEAYLGACHPVARDVGISSGVVVGREVTGVFTYFDANQDTEGTHLYQWYIAETADAQPQKIVDAEAVNYIIPQEHEGKYLIFEVTPLSAERPYQGLAVKSAPVLITSTNSAPSANDLSIKGKAMVGSAITAAYNFIDPDGDAEGESLIQWYISDTSDGTFTPIDGEIFDRLVPNSQQLGRFVLFEVTPVDEYGLAGEPVRGTPVMVEAAVTNEYHVALSGDDSNPGSAAEPFATLEKARDTVREHIAAGELPYGGITVYLHEGVYHIQQSFALGEQDSGTADSPIVYRQYQNDRVSISGGIEIDYSKFGLISDNEMKGRLIDETAKSKVMAADLSEIGLTDFDGFTIRKPENNRFVQPIFTFDGKMLKLVRWPNTDKSSEWPRVTTLNRGYCDRYTSDPSNNGTGLAKVQYTTDRPNSWGYNFDEIIYNGYWRYDWANEVLFATVDKKAKTIEAQASLFYGCDGSNRPFQVFNVFEELDEPGEWYIDRTGGKMYLYPYETTNDTPVFKMTDKDFDLITINNASHVTISGIEVTAGKQKGITIDGGTEVCIDNCSINGFENVGLAINSGAGNGVKNSRVFDCGIGGIILNGGDKTNIIPAGNYVENCDIHDFAQLQETYAPGVSLNGVGNVVKNCEIHSAPHAAILFNGVDNVVEYNSIHDVCLNAGDMGAIYTGRHLDDHDNIIRFNHFYGIGNELNAQYPVDNVFTDDGSCDLIVYGNIFGVNPASSDGVKNHGGMNNRFYHNVFLDTEVTFVSSDWTDNRWKVFANLGDLKSTFRLVENNENYLKRWPWLNMLKGNMDDFAFINNTFAKNAIFYINWKNTNSWLDEKATLANGHDVDGKETNQVFYKDTALYKTYFRDFDNGDYTLTKEGYAAIRQHIPDFPDINLEAIGYAPVTNAAPLAQDVKIITINENTKQGSYIYTDAERDPEGATVYRWLISDSLDGTYLPIDGMDGDTLNYTEDFIGKYVKFEVTPIDDQGRAGQPVLSAAAYLAGGREDLLAMLNEAEEIFNSASAGTNLGQYPQQALDDFEAVIDQVRFVYEDETSSLTAILSAADSLMEALGIFRAAAVTELETSLTDIIIYPGIDKAKITLTGEPAGAITIRSTAALPQTTLLMVVDGREVIFEIAGGTNPQGGSLTISMNVTPSEEIDGTVHSAFSIGNDNEPLDVKVTYAGAAGQSVVLIADEVFEELGTIGTDNSFNIAQGGQYVLATLAPKSNDASLESIAIDGTPLSGFKAGKTSYQYYVPAGTKSVVVTAVAVHERATVTPSSQTVTLPGTATITVTAPDAATTRVYTVKITEKAVPTSNPAVTWPGTGSNGTTGNTSSGLLFNNNTQPGFTDIDGHWAKDDIEAMAAKGVVSGVTETTFEPDRNITRAEFATLICKALGITAVNSGSFADVMVGEWYFPYVNAAASAGLIVGYDGYFRPDDLITRQEMAVILAKAYAFWGYAPKVGGIDKFSDKESIADWAYSSVDTAATAGLIFGLTQDTFGPYEYTTRAQAVSVLKRLLD